jgi:uncharacterized protein (DUF2147 family)
MSRSKLLLAMAALFLGFGQICAETANSPTGIWLTQAGDAKFLDDKNAHRSFAKRPIIGINIFSGMKSVTNNKWSGTIYNADDGKSYSSDVIAAGPRKLEVRGCVMSILCGGETWTKIGEVTLAEANN